MAAWGYEFYLLVLKASLTSERSEQLYTTMAIIFIWGNSFKFIRILLPIGVAFRIKHLRPSWNL